MSYLLCGGAPAAHAAPASATSAYATSAYATSAYAAESAAAYRLQISPTQSNLGTLEPGQTYTGSFRVQNTGTQGYAYQLSISPYSVKNSNYDPNFIDHSSYTEITDWITLGATDGYVEAGSSNLVEFSVAVPADAPGNGQNAAIMVTMSDPDGASASGIKTNRQVAFLVYGNVAGATRRTAEIISNEVPGFLFEPPVTFSATVKNTGNIYATASYVVEVRGLTDGRLVYTNADEKNGQIIFPESTRDNAITWDDAPTLGVFRVKQTISIFDETFVTEKLIFIFPGWFLGIMITFIGLILAWFAQKIHCLYRRNRPVARPSHQPRPAYGAQLARFGKFCQQLPGTLRRNWRALVDALRDRPEIISAPEAPATAQPLGYYTWQPSPVTVPIEPAAPAEPVAPIEPPAPVEPPAPIEPPIPAAPQPVSASASVPAHASIPTSASVSAHTSTPPSARPRIATTNMPPLRRAASPSPPPIPPSSRRVLQ